MATPLLAVRRERVAPGGFRLRQNSPYFLQTSSAPDRGSRAFDEITGKCPRCNSLRTIEINTNGRGKLVEIPRPCQHCRIAGLLRKHAV